LAAARGLNQLKKSQDESLIWDDMFQITSDPDSGVRFHLALVLGRCDAPQALSALVALLEHDDTRWMRLAVLCGTGQNPWPLIRELLNDADGARRHAAFIEQASEQFGVRADDKRLAESLDRLTMDSARPRSPGELAALAGLSRGLFARGRSLGAPGLTAEQLPDRVMDGLREIVAAATALARDTSQTEADRIMALAIAANGEQTTIEKWIGELVMPSQPQPLQSAAVWAAAQANSSSVWNALFHRWASHTRTTREVQLAQSLRSPAGIHALVESLEADIVTAEELPSSIWEVLGQMHDEPLRRRLQPLLAALVPADRSEVLARYSDVTDRRGDSTRGAGIFKQHCQACHAMQGIGHRVGPDLASVASRPNDQLLVDILDPSRQVSPDYVNYLVETKDGRILTGLIAAETADSVTLRREENQQDLVSRSNIEQLRATGKSIMPDGLEQKLSPDLIADLLEFLHHADVSQLKSAAGR
jgi:putative heme-binding domain-containing protein